mmetsp:Transcript_29333/g.86767  ORF Transcript_29333/g.86767 Transcript_29333/m.86767 type:complete len:110 (-) Transcript_29333:908-1237(-)
MGLHGLYGLGCMELHEPHGAAWSCMQMQWLQFEKNLKVFKVSVNVNHCRNGCCLGCCRCISPPAQAASPDQAALPRPPPLPAGPPHPPATSKGWDPSDSLGKPFSHMYT